MHFSFHLLSSPLLSSPRQHMASVKSPGYISYASFEKFFAASTAEGRILYCNLMAAHLKDDSLVLVPGAPDCPKTNKEWEEHYKKLTAAFDDAEASAEKEKVVASMEELYKNSKVSTSS